MAEIFTSAYEELLGTAKAREETVNLEFLNIPGCDLQELDGIFTEDEIWNTIKELPPDQAPGPDGFIGAFYQCAWPIIKQDVFAILMKLYIGDGRGFAKLNR